MSYARALPQPVSQTVVEEDPSIPYEALITAAKAQLGWMKEVEEVIVAHGGKTAKEINPSSWQSIDMPWSSNSYTQPIQLSQNTAAISPLSDPKTVSLQYKVYRTQHWSEPVAVHLTALYAELFEACWKGDTATVERLCLPPKSGKRDKNATYLQVAAEVVPLTGQQLGTNGMFATNFSYRQ